MKTFFSLLFVSGVLFISCNGSSGNNGANAETPKTYEQRLQEAKSKILNSPDWLEEEKKKAAERKIELDSMISIDTRWILDEEDGKHKTIIEPAYDAERLKTTEAKIRNSPEWLKAEEKKAKDRNITLDSMLYIDTRWQIDEEDGKHKP